MSDDFLVSKDMQAHVHNFSLIVVACPLVAIEVSITGFFFLLSSLLLPISEIHCLLSSDLIALIELKLIREANRRKLL